MLPRLQQNDFATFYACPETAPVPDCADKSRTPADCSPCIEVYMDGSRVGLESRLFPQTIHLGHEIEINGQMTDSFVDYSVIEAKGSRRVIRSEIDGHYR